MSIGNFSFLRSGGEIWGIDIGFLIGLSAKTTHIRMIDLLISTPCRHLAFGAHARKSVMVSHFICRSKTP